MGIQTMGHSGSCTRRENVQRLERTGEPWRRPCEQTASAQAVHLRQQCINAQRIAFTRIMLTLGQHDWWQQLAVVQVRPYYGAAFFQANLVGQQTAHRPLQKVVDIWSRYM